MTTEDRLHRLEQLVCFLIENSNAVDNYEKNYWGMGANDMKELIYCIRKEHNVRKINNNNLSD